MSLRRTLALVLGSLLLHVTAAAGGLLLASRMGAREPLVVDLTQPELSPAPTGSEPGQPVVRPPSLRAAHPARGGPRASTREPTAPSPPLEPVAAPRVASEPAPVETRPEVTPAAPPVSEPPAPAPASPPSGTLATPAPPPAAGAPPRGGSDSGGPRSTSSGVTGAGAGARLALSVPGDGGAGVPAEYTAYLARFRQRVQQVVSYPLAARRRGISGTVEIEALIDEAGRVRDVRVLTSSSHAVLDEAAVEALRRVPPVPFPADVPPRRLTVRLPLVFDLK